MAGHIAQDRIQVFQPTYKDLFTTAYEKRETHYLMAGNLDLEANLDSKQWPFSVKRGSEKFTVRNKRGIFTQKLKIS